MKPSVGRVVHYREFDSKHRAYGKCTAAIITEVRGDAVHLAVFPMGLFGFREWIREGIAPGTWHWPERVE